ncbi:MAG: hypothetical protein ACLPY5_15960 [Candidatus Bathyarchaeia archaeon]
MSELVPLLEPICAQLEDKIRKEISGPFNLPKKLIYDRIMPLRVNVTTPSERSYFELLPGGRVQLHQGSAAESDVTISSELAVLKELIVRQSKSFFEDAEKNRKILVKSQTWKGEQAVTQVRQLFSKMP